MSDRTRGQILSVVQWFGAALVAVCVPISGYFFDAAFTALTDHRSRLIQVEAVAAQTVKDVERIDQTNRETAALLGETSRQLAERRANAFTAQEGNAMQIQVAKQATLLAEQTRVASDTQQQLAQIRSGLERVWQAVREHPPERRP